MKPSCLSCSVLAFASVVEAEILTIPGDFSHGVGVGVPGPFPGTTARYQEVFSSSAFQQAGGPIYITDFSWRDLGGPTSGEKAIPSLTVEMSTTAKTPAN